MIINNYFKSIVISQFAHGAVRNNDKYYLCFPQQDKKISKELVWQLLIYQQGRLKIQVVRLMV